jgi:hypothetical protein
MKLAGRYLNIRGIGYRQGGFDWDFRMPCMLHYVPCELQVSAPRDYDGIGGISFIFGVMINAIGTDHEVFGIL